MRAEELASLTSGVLGRFWTIDAVSPEGSRKVWDSKRMPEFVSPERTGELIEHAEVHVASLSANDLEPLRAAIRAVDGDHRLVP